MDWLRFAVAIAITILWLALYLKAFFDEDFTAPPEISGIMLAVVTWLFGVPITNRVLRRAKKKWDEIDEEERKDEGDS